MAINITKYTRYIPWDEEGIGASRREASSSGIKIDLSQYYTISQLQTIGQSQILFDNIIEAYHNKMLGLQGGLVIEDSSETPSGAGDDEFYHLDAETYSRVIIWEFLDSLIEESDGTIHLVNDEDDPGILKYYGTDISGVKGWFDLPEESSSGGGTHGGESLWQEDSIGDLSPITVGAGITVDGLFIKDRSIESIDNELGDGTGDLSLIARNGAIYLVPGYDDDSEVAVNVGVIFLGDNDFPQNYIDIRAKGIEDDVNISIIPKGWGTLGLGDNIGYQTTIFSNGWYHYFRSNQIYLGIPESALHDDENRVYIRPDYAYNYSGKSVWLLAGSSSSFAAGLDGGDLYLMAGTGSVGGSNRGGHVYIHSGYAQAGTHGDIFFGYAGTGCLPEADSDEVYGVTYDPVTGKLSYAYLGEIGSGGEGVTPYNFGMSLLEDSSGVVTLENDEASPGNDQYYGTNSSGTKGWYASTKSFQTASFANPLNIDCTTYKDWICTVTGDCTINLNNANDGDAGMLELIIDASGVDITMGAMWTKKMGPTDLDMTDGADNIISWRAIGEGSTQEIVYTVGIIEV